ncbi:MAG: GreA/GreB family elongation factor [Myxococcota bacterium]
MEPDKEALLRALLRHLERERDVLVAAQKLSQQGVVHADAKADGNKDMRATEASYIARGQAQRAEALEQDVQRVRALRGVDLSGADARVALTAVVEVESDAGEARYLVAPAGGGSKLAVGDFDVVVVTPQAPLGKALLGRQVGDVVELVREGRAVEYEIVSLR